MKEALAACANILPACRSIYRWQGEIERDEEVPTLFKTTASGADALIARIAELHSYDVPAIAVWSIERALPAYADWVASEVRNGKG